MAALVPGGRKDSHDPVKASRDDLESQEFHFAYVLLPPLQKDKRGTVPFLEVLDLSGEFCPLLRRHSKAASNSATQKAPPFIILTADKILLFGVLMGSKVSSSFQL